MNILDTRRPIKSVLIALILLLLTLLAAHGAGSVRAASPAIRGYHWIDTNCNGLRDSGEPPITDVAVYLYSAGPDNQPFTGDDRQIRVVQFYISGPDAGLYEDTNDSSGAGTTVFRLSILQGGRPAGYVPTRYRQGDDPARWSSLEANWATTGFQVDPNGTVTGGNIGMAPASCTQQWLPHHTFAPFVRG